MNVIARHLAKTATKDRFQRLMVSAMHDLLEIECRVLTRLARDRLKQLLVLDLLDGVALYCADQPILRLARISL